MGKIHDGRSAPAYLPNRQVIEDQIEQLIAMLDDIDEDPDLEDDDLDLEEADPMEDDGDREPMLGWSESFGVARWGADVRGSGSGDDPLCG
jgi:hypothetical protein